MRVLWSQATEDLHESQASTEVISSWLAGGVLSRKGISPASASHSRAGAGLPNFTASRFPPDSHRALQATMLDSPFGFLNLAFPYFF